MLMLIVLLNSAPVVTVPAASTWFSVNKTLENVMPDGAPAGASASAFVVYCSKAAVLAAAELWLMVTLESGEEKLDAKPGVIDPMDDPAATSNVGATVGVCAFAVLA